jgi:hypothetical protein
VNAGRAAVGGQRGVRSRHRTERAVLRTEADPIEPPAIAARLAVTTEVLESGLERRGKSMASSCDFSADRIGENARSPELRQGARSRPGKIGAGGFYP